MADLIVIWPIPLTMAKFTMVKIDFHPEFTIAFLKTKYIWGVQPCHLIACTRLMETKFTKENPIFSSDIIYTIQDGRVYRGNSTFSNECVLTFNENKIYMGDSTFSSDLLFTIQGDPNLSIAIIACIVGPY